MVACRSFSVGSGSVPLGRSMPALHLHRRTSRCGVRPVRFPEAARMQKAREDEDLQEQAQSEGAKAVGR